jgi:hypothetical protein
LPDRRALDGSTPRRPSGGALVSQIVTVIHSLSAGDEGLAHSGIIDGAFTLPLRLENVDASYADGTGVTGAIYLAHGATGFAPKFDTSDHWPIVTDSLVDPDAIGDVINAFVTFPNGYVSGGHWVSGPIGSGAISLNMVLNGRALTRPLESGVIAVGLSDGGDVTIASSARTFRPRCGAPRGRAASRGQSS